MVYDKKFIGLIMSARTKTTSVTLDIIAVANLKLLSKKGTLLFNLIDIYSQQNQDEHLRDNLPQLKTT